MTESTTCLLYFPKAHCFVDIVNLHKSRPFTNSNDVLLLYVRSNMTEYFKFFSLLSGKMQVIPPAPSLTPGG